MKSKHNKIMKLNSQTNLILKGQTKKIIKKQWKKIWTKPSKPVEKNHVTYDIISR